MIASPSGTLPSSPSDPQAPPTILVIDEEVLLRLRITDEFSGNRCTVLEAASVDEAMEVLNRPVRIDFVFLVIRRGEGIDGAAFVEWLQIARPEIKIFIASADPGASGADKLVPKLHSKLDVIRTIRDLFGVQEIQNPDRSHKRRQLAAECLALAQHCADMNIRASLLLMSQKWLDLAELGSRQQDIVDLRAIQTQLGRELRALYELPRQLPHRLFMLLMQLNEQLEGEPAPNASNNREGS